MLTTSKFLIPLTLMVSFGLFSPGLFAQSSESETVFFTGPQNQISRVVEFLPAPLGGTSFPVIDESGTNYQGLVIREDLLTQWRFVLGQRGPRRCRSGGDESARSRLSAGA